MQNKSSRKSQIKLIVIALALLLCLAISIGVATAFYQTKRKAIGYVNMDKGLFFEVQNMKSADNDTLLYFKDKDVSVAPIELTTTGFPNEQFYIANPTITPLEGTVPYAVRGYLEYIFYDNTGAVKTVDELGGDLNAVLNKLFVLDSLNSPISFGENWLHDSRTNYYYSVDSMTAGQVVTNIKEHSYEVGGTSTGTTKVFAEQTVSGEPVSFLTLANWGGEYGGPIVNGIEIGKFTIELNLEVLQYNEMALMSEWDMSKTFVDDQGNISEIQGDKITLEDGAEIGNGADSITFESGSLEALLPESGGSVSLNASSFSDKVNLEEVTISGNPTSKTTVYIGSKAFYGCTKLKMNLTEHENIEYVIASDAFSAGATIKHGATDITGLVINPSTSGQTAGVDNKWPVASNVYLFLPNTTLTPSATSYGDYEYTDEQGTWYFDLLDSSGNKVTLNQAQSGGVSTLGAGALATSTDYVARINRCDNLTTVNDYIIPALIGTTELEGQLFKVVAFACRRGDGVDGFSNPSYVKAVSLPQTLISIGNYAFSECKFSSIDIPNSVTSIEGSAFMSCYSLTSITIPNGVTQIQNDTFVWCFSLVSVTIGNSVSWIASNAFLECNSLDRFIANGMYSTLDDGNLLMKGTEIVAFAPYGITDYTIPNGVTVIGGSAFARCRTLTNLTIPNSVTSIEGYAFEDCVGLTSITIGQNMSEIYGGAFSGCDNLDKFITSGNGIYTTLDNGNLLMKGTEIVAFAPYGITEYVIPEGVTSIGDSAFCDCRGLTSITIPDSVTSIGSKAFIGCSYISEVSIGNGVKKIGDTAFYGCDRLATINIPDSVTEIDGTAFRFSGLTNITIPDSVTRLGFGVFYNCNSLETVKLGNGITAIPDYCFHECSKLKTITVGSRVTKIGNEAFYACPNLTTFNWTIEYDLIGVSADVTNGVIVSDSVNLGTEGIIGDAPTNIESGVSFFGWSDGTTTYQPGDPYTFTLGNRTLKAVWSHAKVFFDANGGEGTIGPITADKSIGVTLPDGSALSRTDYTFLGWSTNKNATTAEYTAGSVVYESGTLYAIWKSHKIYVTFDPNGGVGTGYTVGILKGGEIDLADHPNTFTREGHIFLGWSKVGFASGNYAQYSPTWSGLVDNLNSGNDVTLCAVWQKVMLTVKFNPNGADGEFQTVEMHYKEKIDFSSYSSSLRKNDYVLCGWGFDASGNARYGAHASMLINDVNNGADAILYAIWRKEDAAVRLEFDLSKVVGQSNVIVYGELNTSVNGPNVMNFRNAQGQAIYGWSRTQEATDYDYSANSGLYLNSSYFAVGQTTTLYPVWTNVYTIHFDANGGTGKVPADMEVWQGIEVSPIADGLTKDGYTLAGWDDDSNFSYGWPDIRKDVPNYFYGESDITYYAVWAAPVTLIFDANDGEGTVPETMTVNFMESMTVPTGEGLTRVGYKLKGWDRKPNADVEDYDLSAGSSQTVQFLSGSYTLYAVWEKLNNEIYFGSLQGSQIEAAQGIWAGKDSLTSAEQDQLKTAVGYDNDDMVKFMPIVYLGNSRVSENWTDSYSSYGVRGYPAKITSDTFTVVFPNALPTGWKLLNYKYEVLKSGDVTNFDGKAQAVFTHEYVETSATTDRMIFLFTLPDQPADDVSTTGQINAMPGNLFEALINGGEMDDGASYYAFTGFNVELYDNENTMLWLGVSGGENAFAYNFATGTYKLVISTENIVGVAAAKSDMSAELEILENVSLSTADGKTTITFTYTYSKDTPEFIIVPKIKDAPITGVSGGYGLMEGAPISDTFYENLMPTFYRGAFAYMGFTNAMGGEALTDEELNYAGYIGYLLMEGLLPESEAFGGPSVSSIEIWMDGYEYSENFGAFAFVKGATYTLKATEEVKSLTIIDFGNSQFYDCGFTYNEESGLYESTFTISASAGSELNFYCGSGEFDLTSVEGLPEYDANTDYTPYLSMG